MPTICMTGPASFMTFNGMGANIIVPRVIFEGILIGAGNTITNDAKKADVLLYSRKDTVKYKTAVAKGIPTFKYDQFASFQLPPDAYQKVVDTICNIADGVECEINEFVDKAPVKPPKKEKLPPWWGIPVGDAM